MKAVKRHSLSTLLVFFFFFILLFLGLFAEVFESQTPEVDIAQIYANPIPVDELQHLKNFKLINKHGTFYFENTHSEADLSGPWQMVEPQVLKLKNDIVVKIIDALNVIRVRNFYRLEPINISSFSLDNPNLTLFFTNDENKNIEIKVGLINPIDNSAYLSLSRQDQIYQIDPIEMALESYDLAQLVESKVFALNSNSLNSFEIQNKDGTTLKISKRDDGWVDSTGIMLSDAKVSKFMDRLEEVKSYSILDQLTPEQQSFMENTTNTASYRLKIVSAQGVRNILISEIKGQLPGLAGVKNGSFALSNDDRKSFVLIEGHQLKVLQTKSSELK